MASESYAALNLSFEKVARMNGSSEVVLKLKRVPNAVDADQPFLVFAGGVSEESGEAVRVQNNGSEDLQQCPAQKIRGE